VSLISSAIVSATRESAYARSAAQQADRKSDQMRERHRHKLRGDAVDEDRCAGERLDQQLDEESGAEEHRRTTRPAIRRGQSLKDQDPREAEER
jgi:hypothetical protein